MAKVVGLTGGIGSGKSTVAKFFAFQGIPIYYADDEAKTLTSTHPQIIAELKSLLGDTIYLNGELNRPLMASIIFNNKNILEQVNQIIHPRVAEHFDRWVLQFPNAPFVIKEAAILLESGAYKQVDTIISVIAPLELRIARVIKRDKVTREQVEQRISNQFSDEQRLAMSNFIIFADEKQLVIPQVLAIYQKII